MEHIWRYKLTNVELSKPQFDLRDGGAFLIEDRHYEPSSEFTRLLFESGKVMTMDFSQSFRDSRIIIETQSDDRSISNAPFDIDRCVFGALAIAIAFDQGFACGQGAQNNHMGDKFHVIDNTSYVFFGLPGNVVVDDANIQYLRSIYEFVYKSLTVKERDLRKIRLMHLFLRGATYSGDVHHKFLDFSIPDVLDGIGSNIAYSYLLMENVFTRMGERRDEGIALWNAIFGRSGYIDQDDIDIVASYRHSFFHDNPRIALKKIKEWSIAQGLDPDEATGVARAREKALLVALKNIKIIMRTISAHYDFSYHEFRDKLPR